MKLYFVEGNIGTGKSTFLGMIEKCFPAEKVQVIYEPVDMWRNFTDKQGKNILDYFYSDPKRYAYIFQSIAFVSRAEKLKEIDTTKEYVFIERSIWSDRNIFAKNCYENQSMSDIEFLLYEKWFSWLEGELKDSVKDFSIIYLKSPSEVCLNRVNVRKRPEEQGILLDYLQQLERKHEEWLGGLDRDMVKILDATVPFKEEKVFRELVSGLIFDKFIF